MSGLTPENRARLAEIRGVVNSVPNSVGCPGHAFHVIDLLGQAPGIIRELLAMLAALDQPA